MSTIEKYGKFLTSEGCFEITAEPPRKWRNIHYNQWGGDEYYAEATHIGDGMSRYRDARGNTVNVIGYDAKYLYLRDDETNTVFNPAGMPVATDVADRVIRIYPSQTEIASSCVGLRATPIAEAMLALVLMDHYLRHRAQNADVRSATPDIEAGRRRS